MTKQKAPKEKIQMVNNKEQNAFHTFTLTFRDRDHFYKVVNWMNTHVGKGTHMWTTQGSILKHLNTGKSITTKVYVFIKDFDPSSTLYLSLV